MTFELETLRETLGDEKFGELKKHVDDLVGARDSARRESIEGRKTLKSEAETLRAFKEKVLDKFGLETVDQFDAIPDAKAATDAAKVLETRVKRLESELAAKDAALGDLDTRFKGTRIDSALAKALAAHEFIDRDLVGEHLRKSIKFDGDDLVYATDDGKTIPVDEGVKLFAASKPHLMKSTGTGGSGFNPGAGSGKDKTFAEMTLTERGELYKKDPARYESLSKGA